MRSSSQDISVFICHHTRSYKWFVIISLHLLWLLMFLFGMFIPWNSHLFDSWRYFALTPQGSKNYHVVARPGEVMRETEKTISAVVARLCTTHVDCLTLPVYRILHDFVWFECFSRSCVKGYLMFHVWNSSPYESRSQLPSPHVPIDSTNWRVQPEGNEGNCRSWGRWPHLFRRIFFLFSSLDSTPWYPV